MTEEERYYLSVLLFKDYKRQVQFMMGTPETPIALAEKLELKECIEEMNKFDQQLKDDLPDYTSADGGEV